MSGILVLGGYSELAWHLCRRLVDSATPFVLVGRDPNRLARVAADLEARGAPQVTSICADLAYGDAAAIEACLRRAPDEVSTITRVIIAYGILEHEDPAHMEITNAVSPARWVERLMIHLPQGAHIMVFGSVAGDRVRASNRVYGQAKANLEAAIDALRVDARQRQIGITLIKPGPTRTWMTRHMPPGFLWSDPEDVAAHLAQTLPDQPAVVYAPPWWRWIMWFIRMLPGPVFRRLPI